jgi:hypothetical protein
MSETKKRGLVKGSAKAKAAGKKMQETKKQKKLLAAFEKEVVGKKNQQIGGLKNHYKKLGLKFNILPVFEKAKKESGLKISKVKSVENTLKNQRPVIALNVANLKKLFVHEINGKIIISTNEVIHGKTSTQEINSTMQGKVYAEKTTKQKYNVDSNETEVSFY